MFVRNLLGTGVLIAALVVAQTPESLMGAALHQERVTGNLQAAIDGYKKVLAAGSVPRALAAQAQYHIGLCYEKLGNLEARKAFESIVRDYADQVQLVAQARTRLGVLSVGASARARLIWDNAGHDWGTASADGRFLSFIDWDAWSVDIHDLITGENLRIFDKGGPVKRSGEPARSAVSPDGKRVAFAWMRFNRPRTEWEYDELHVLNADGSGHKVLLAGHGIDYIEPQSWSADGKWIVCGVNYRDGRPSPVALVSASDGQTRLIQSDSRHFKSRAMLSPDGKWLAYTSGPRAQPQALFLTAADGSNPAPAKLQEDASMMGWVPGGSALLFSRERLGAHHLYVLPVSDGKAIGEAQQIHAASNVRMSPLALTAEGVLLFASDNRRADAALYEWRNGAVQLSSAKDLFPVADEVNLLLTGGAVQYSSDGKRLFGVTPSRGILVRDLATGTERTIAPRTRDWVRAGWGADSNSILLQKRSGAGKWSIIQLGLADGSEKSIAELDGLQMHVAVSRDGETLFHGRPQAVFARDLETGGTRQIWSGAVSGPFEIKPSRDGSRLAIRGGRYLGVVELASGKTFDIQTDTGEASSQPTFVSMEWSPDDKHLLAIARTGRWTDPMELWSIPTGGGDPGKQPLPYSFRGLSISPDGSNVVTARVTQRNQVWALENFLPAKK